jgi:hypothetical protein
LELHINQVHEIIAQNKKGIKPEKPENKPQESTQVAHDYDNVVGQESLTRFDAAKRKKNKNKNKNKTPQQAQNAVQNTENRSEAKLNETNPQNAIQQNPAQQAKPNNQQNQQNSENRQNTNSNNQAKKPNNRHKNRNKPFNKNKQTDAQ